MPHLLFYMACSTPLLTESAEEFSKLGVRVGAPGCLEGSLFLPPGMLGLQASTATVGAHQKYSPSGDKPTSILEKQDCGTPEGTPRTVVTV